MPVADTQCPQQTPCPATPWCRDRDTVGDSDRQNKGMGRNCCQVLSFGVFLASLQQDLATGQGLVVPGCGLTSTNSGPSAVVNKAINTGRACGGPGVGTWPWGALGHGTGLSQVPGLPRAPPSHPLHPVPQDSAEPQPPRGCPCPSSPGPRGVQGWSPPCGVQCAASPATW